MLRPSPLVLSSLLSVLLAALSAPASAQPAPEGYLCCNMRTDGNWISDINYAENGKRILAVGTPLKVTGYGRYRAYVDIGDTKQALGNDYSRDLALGEFAARYVVPQDPRPKIASFPARIREAILSARLVPGMTREQVLMSVGYPVSSENPNLDAKVWRFWRSSFAEFQVVFDERGLVREITTDPQTRNLVVMD